MKAVFTLTSAESRRLIAKAVLAVPEVQKAWNEAYLLLAGGTTNAFIAQELLHDDAIEPGRCTAGISCDGVLCVTAPDSRKSYPNVFLKGEAKDMTLTEALNDYHAETVVIKGANAVDMQGYVGVITAGFDGGTIPRIIGTVTSKGLLMITPVGLEKLVPSVRESARALGGASHIDYSLGADCGMYCLGNTVIITEIEAIKLLFDCEAHLVCCGGVGAQVEEFVNSFKECDIALLVYVMEAMVAGMKANFTEYDSYVYDLLMLSAESMVIKGPDVEADDDES